MKKSIEAGDAKTAERSSIKRLRAWIGSSRFEQAPSMNSAPPTPVLDEISQALLRIYLHTIFVVLAILAYRIERQISIQTVTLISVASLVSALVLYVWARRLSSPERGVRARLLQRSACIVSDNLFVGLVLYIGGESLAFVWAIYIWTSIGYGVRYGVSYLRWNVAISLVSFSLVTQFAPFWNTRPLFAFGLGLAMAAVPLYMSWLIERLHTAVQQREIAYRAKSDFVAKMSHELRTPLHAIISTTDLLRSATSEQDRNELLNVISVASSTLLSLINRVLDLSKFESGIVHLTSAPMNIHAVVCEVGTIIWPEAERKGLALHVFSDPEISCTLLGPADEFKEILLNLLGNAAKFTDAGEISLTVTLGTEDADSVTLRAVVSDTGPGIPAETLPTIFEPFVQADSTIKRRHGGSGLGASFAKELTRLMGGEISVSSELGVGTRFELTFELKKPPASNPIAAIYPLTIIVLASKPPEGALAAMLRTFRVQVVHAPTLVELSRTVQQLQPEARPHGVIVNADDFGNILPRVLGLVGISNARRPIPVAAFGDISFRTSAISAGYCSYLSAVNETTLAGVLSTIAALSTPNREIAEGIKQTPIIPLRILAADDDATNRKLIERVLRQAGHECKIVADGEEALFELHDHHYDLAILDMHMPKRDGIEVAKIYRFARFDSAATIPIILLTADSSMHALKEAASAGVNRFLTKPIKPADLIDAISSTYAGTEVQTAPPPHAASFEEQPSTNISSLHSYRRQLQTPNRDEYVSSPVLSDLLGFMTKEEQTSFCAEFCIDADEYVRSIEAAKTNDEIAKAQYDDMHSLAGAAITIGAAELARLAKRIETLSEQGIREERNGLLRDLRAQCDATIRHIRENYLAPRQ